MHQQHQTQTDPNQAPHSASIPNSGANDLGYLERKLGARLLTVAQAISGGCHADIGCDHALLPIYLVRSGRATSVIAVEKHPGPLALARQRLLKYAQATLRAGDGLEPLQVGEIDSLSICGMGGRSIESILSAHPERVPTYLVVQPNDHPECIHHWAQSNGYSVHTLAAGDPWWVFSLRKR